MNVRACLLYDFKLKKPAMESHRSLVAAFGEDVVCKRQYKRRFQRLPPATKALKTKSMRDRLTCHRLPLKKPPRELAVEFSCSKFLSRSICIKPGSRTAAADGYCTCRPTRTKPCVYQWPGFFVAESEILNFSISSLRRTTNEFAFHFTWKRQWLKPGELDKPVANPAGETLLIIVENILPCKVWS
ncbi:unnamed protein product [Heligmosomoides polygyrus]|uniref:HTH_48 domain-containing protein n=1 Tax=Heligmosomoides polygyrus TaxID=6339 RepID=A0A183GEM8_HELPZ|nr:unnamed protein product [Heligmosomoides polygyrus]